MNIHNESVLARVNRTVPAAVTEKSTVPGILFVDDELSALLGIRRALRNHFDIKAIDCPVAALEYLVVAENISVIVTDLQMPGMDGLTFLKEASALQPDASLIILTGNPTNESAIDAINEIGVARYLRKPCGVSDLIGALSEGLKIHEEKTTPSPEETAVRPIDPIRSGFFSKVSHELRTPLHQILLCADLLALGDRTQDEVGEYIDYIRNGCSKLEESIKRITEYSRLCASDAPPCLSIFPINCFFDECRQHLAMTAPEYGVEMSFNLDSGSPTIVGDETLLKGAVIALASNALRFSKKGGVVDLSVHSNADNLQIRVSDAGIGISDAQIEEALRPFSQLDDGLTRKHEGLGLGLSFVEEVARLHGGEVLLMENQMAGSDLIADIIIPQCSILSTRGRLKPKLRVVG